MGVLDISLLSLNSGTEFAQRVAVLNVPLGAHEEREFREYEHKIRPIESVRNRDVFVIQSIHDGSGGSVNGKLCRLLFSPVRLRIPLPSASRRWRHISATHARTAGRNPGTR